MKKLFVGFVLLAAVRSIAGAQSFQPGKSTSDHFKKGDVDVTRGGFSGYPAWKLVFPADHYLVANVGQAKDWNAARSACRLLAPAGAWDLPQFTDLMFAQAAGASKPLASLGPVALYANWARSDNAADDAKFLAGTDTILMGGGPDAQNDPAMGSLTGFIKLSQHQLPTLGPDERKATQEVIRKLSAGVDILCVSRSAH